MVFTKIRATRKEQRAQQDGLLADLIDKMAARALGRSAAPTAHRAIKEAVALVVEAALQGVSRPWTGFNAAIAIGDLRRTGLEARLVRGTDEIVRRRLHNLLRAAIAAGLRPLTEIVQSSLSTALIGVSVFKVYQAGGASCGGPLWLPYLAMMDYAARVLGVPLERNLIDAVEAGGLFWTLDGVIFAAERPRQLNRDTDGLLHCELGPSLAYPSGWAWWHWHGVAVPQDIIEQPERITRSTIGRAQDPALRRVIIERYRAGEDIEGIAAYLRDAGGMLIDDDKDFGRLWDLGGDPEAVLIAEVTNRSPEPDGSRRRFFLPIHPELRPILPQGGYGEPQPQTARNAVASTFGLTGDEYAPEKET